MQSRNIRALLLILKVSRAMKRHNAEKEKYIGIFGMHSQKKKKLNDIGTINVNIQQIQSKTKVD